MHSARKKGQLSAIYRSPQRPEPLDQCTRCMRHTETGWHGFCEPCYAELMDDTPVEQPDIPKEHQDVTDLDEQISFIYDDRHDPDPVAGATLAKALRRHARKLYQEGDTVGAAETRAMAGWYTTTHVYRGEHRVPK